MYQYIRYGNIIITLNSYDCNLQNNSSSYVFVGDKVYNRQFSAPILKRKTSQLITPILSILPGIISIILY